MAKRVWEKVYFRFSGENLKRDRQGSIPCDVCMEMYHSPHVEMELLDSFLICPSCILAGPAAVAMKLAAADEDRDRLAKYWGYSENELDREDLRNMAGTYRRLAKSLRGLKSFEELPGGKFAMELAELQLSFVKQEKGKAA